MTFVLAIAFLGVLFVHTILMGRQIELLWPFIPAFAITFAVDIASALHQMARALSAIAAAQIREQMRKDNNAPTV